MSSAPSAPVPTPVTPPAAVVTLPAATAPGPDPHSFARPAEARVHHVGLDLTVDFTARTLSGTATLAVERAASGDTLVLDTRDLEIEAVEAATVTLTTPPRLATAALAWATTTCAGPSPPTSPRTATGTSIPPSPCTMSTRRAPCAATRHIHRPLPHKALPCICAGLRASKRG